MNTLLNLGLTVITVALLNACGGNDSARNTPISTTPATATSTTVIKKIDDALWTDKDKANSINSCKFSRKNDDPAKVEKMCSCYLQKVIELSPSPYEQSKISTSNAIKINVDCTKEAGL